MAINFNVTRCEQATVLAIVSRATEMDLLLGDGLQLDMDLCACHCNGIPLKLDALLVADDFNFAHDVVGIQRHMDRETGQLTDCFLPRFYDGRPEDERIADREQREKEIKSDFATLLRELKKASRS